MGCRYIRPSNCTWRFLGWLWVGCVRTMGGEARRPQASCCPRLSTTGVCFCQAQPLNRRPRRVQAPGSPGRLPGCPYRLSQSRFALHTISNRQLPTLVGPWLLPQLSHPCRARSSGTSTLLSSQNNYFVNVACHRPPLSSPFPPHTFRSESISSPVSPKTTLPRFLSPRF